MPVLDPFIPIFEWLLGKLGKDHPPAPHGHGLPYKVPHWTKYKVGDHTVRIISALTLADFMVRFYGIQFSWQVSQLDSPLSESWADFSTFSPNCRCSRRSWPRWGWRTRGSATRYGASTGGSSRPCGATRKCSLKGLCLQKKLSWRSVVTENYNGIGKDHILHSSTVITRNQFYIMQ